MSLIQTPWTSQPQQSVGIDWVNPLTRGLVDAIISADLRSVVNGIQAVTTGTVTSAVGSNGRIRQTPAGGSNKDAYTGTWSRINAPLTLVTMYRITNAAYASRISGNLAASSYGYGLAPNATNFRAIVARSGINTVLTGASVNTSLKVDTLTIDATNASFYENGRLTAGPTTHGGMATPTGDFTFGAENGASNTDGADYYFAVLFNRVLSDAEIRSISQNPWQIFRPLPRRVFVPVSAVTGDATGTGSLYSVTLSSPSATASGTANATASGSLSSVSVSAPSATATGSALATGALTTVTLATVSASATGTALATGSLDAIDLSTVSGSATGTTAGNAEGVGSVATIALSAPTASAVGSALATGSFAHVSLSVVSGTASAAINGQATADLQPISISAPLAIAVAASVATGGIQSIGLTAPTASASGQAQTIARPGSDTSNSGWTPSTGSDLYAMLDEVTPDDADYISTASAGSVCRLGLGAVADPGTSSGQVVSYRASSSTGNGLKVELMQGGTVIATWNHATLPATDTTYQQSLSAAECDAITDYTALSVRLTSL